MNEQLASEVHVCDACPVCEGRTFREEPVPERWIGQRVFRHVAGRLGLARCQACGVVLTRPRPSSGLLQTFYGGSDYRCHDDADRDDVTIKADVLLDRVEKVCGSGGRLLDYGCGSGWLMQRAKQRGWSALGYDMGARAIDTCRAQGIEVVGDLDQLEPKSFEAIVLHHVFEHVEQPRETLRRLKQLLSPGGSLFIEVPNAASLRARMSPHWASRFGIDERYRAFPIHLYYFTPKTLARLLDSEGFDVQIETYGLGVDELIVRGPTARNGNGNGNGHAKSRPAAWKGLVKRVLFGAELGENILAMATPRAEASSVAPEPRRAVATA